ncbi:MAG: Rib/alpha-like domain-containing protein [Corynebacterium sp.]|nr:Rib/alpha-like domain-containing protein [Corynebacterium sp.]
MRKTALFTALSLTASLLASPTVGVLPQAAAQSTSDSTIYAQALNPGTTVNSVNVMWRRTGAKVDQYLQIVKASESFPETTDTAASVKYRKHENDTYRAEFSGLAANTQYKYRVGAPATGWTDPETFTSGSTNASSWNFGAIGAALVDADIDVTDLNAVAAKLGAEKVNFIADTGQDVVTLNTDAQWTQATSSDLFRNNMVATAGPDNVSRNYYDYVNQPKMEVGTIYDRNYYFVHNGVLVIGLASNRLENQNSEWVNKAITAAQDAGETVTWKVVLINKASLGVGDDKTLKYKFVEDFAKAGINLVLTGDSRLHSRTYPLKEDGTPADQPASLNDKTFYQPKDSQQPIWLSLNASTSDATNFLPVLDTADPAFVFSNQDGTPDYTVVHVTPNELTVTTKNVADGSIVDTFTITNNMKANRLNPTYTNATAHKGKAVTVPISGSDTDPAPTYTIAGDTADPKTKVSVGADGKVSITPALDSPSGTFTATVTVTYSDGSTDSVPVTYTTGDLAADYAPAYGTGQVVKNLTPLTLTQTGGTLPQGTTFATSGFTLPYKGEIDSTGKLTISAGPAATEGEKSGTVTITYPDGTKDTVAITYTITQAPVTPPPAKTSAETYTPAYPTSATSVEQGKTGKVNVTGGPFPAGTTFSAPAKNGVSFSFDANGNATITAAANATVAANQKATVTVKYADRTTDTATITYTITRAQVTPPVPEKKLSELNNPAWTMPVITAGTPTTIDQTGDTSMPEGTTYAITESSDPNVKWTIFQDTGQIEVTPTAKAAPGTYSATVNVTYSDGSSSEFDVTFTIQAAPAKPGNNDSSNSSQSNQSSGSSEIDNGAKFTLIGVGAFVGMIALAAAVAYIAGTAQRLIPMYI